MAVAWRRCHLAPSVLPLLASLALLGAVPGAMWVSGATHSGTLDDTSAAAAFRTVLLGLACAAVLRALLIAEGRLRVPTALVRLGGASHALCLGHAAVNGPMLRLVPAPAAVEFVAMLCVAAGVAVALAIHRRYERPPTRLLRQRLPRRAPRPAASAP